MRYIEHFFGLLNVPCRLSKRGEIDVVYIGTADFKAKQAYIDPWFRVLKQNEQDTLLMMRPRGSTSTTIART